MEKESPFLAFSYMFKDNKFWSKFCVLIVLMFLCYFASLVEFNMPKELVSQSWLVLAVLYLVSFVASIFVYGYTSAGVKSIAEQKENYILPFFNIKTHGILGLKLFVASLLFSIAIGVVVSILFLIGAIIVGAIAVFNPIISIIATVLAILIMIIFVLALLVYMPAFFRMFAMTQDILALFRVKTIIESVHKDANNYFKYIGAYVLAGIPLLIFYTFSCVLMLLLTKIVSLLLLIFIISTAGIGAYCSMVYMYICAKCIK